MSLGQILSFIMVSIGAVTAFYVNYLLRLNRDLEVEKKIKDIEDEAKKDSNRPLSDLVNDRNSSRRRDP